MRVFLAGLYTSRFHRGGALYAGLDAAERRARDSATDVLESFHFLRDVDVSQLRRDGVRVFLDSGAFSAFTHGVRIDLRAYCRFVHKHSDVIAESDGQPLCSVLDTIGDPRRTWENQMAMERLGVRPLPCFHYAEDERYLRRYLDAYPYVSLGGMVRVPRPRLEAWLARIWGRYLLDGAGKPRVKVHGFGLTSEELMQRYPWTSVDSTAWTLTSSFGNRIHVPGLGDVPVRRPDSEALRVIRQLGFDPDRLRRYHASRLAFNCWSFTELAARMNRR